MTLILPTQVAPIGIDEQRILDALKKKPDSRVVQSFADQVQNSEVRARYKLEVHFGKDRSISNLKASVGAILIWESGKRFHGGGDEKMYWCGWTRDWPACDSDKVCGLPILTSFFAHFHVVCPHCGRECFLDPATKERHIQAAIRGGKDVRGIKAVPVVVGERFFRLPPPKLAEYLEKLWRELDSNADLYLKFHPSDIRCREVPEAKKPDVYDRARRKRNDGLLIYPLGRLIKDVTAGASVRTRFLACITS